MNSYSLSEEAEQELEDLWVYLTERNDLAADHQIAKLLDCFE
jgi:toxin ParE1/3/4